MPIGITTDVLITCLGAVLGVVLGTRLPDSLKKALNNTLGIAAIAMGIVLILKVKNLSAVVLTLVIGSILGELVMLDDRIRKLVTGVVHKLMNGAAADEQFLAQVSAVVILFCCGGTGWYGALNEGLTGDGSILITKSILDFVTACIFGSILGKIVPMLCIPQAIIYGALFVVSGAAGTGKDSVVKALRTAHPEIEKTVSATTRAPRPGEQEGIDYYYRTTEQFQQLIANDEVVEYNFYNGNYYGTLKEEVNKRLAAGKLVVLVIDVHGAANIRRMFPGATTVFLLPPSVEELERRLRGRGTETEDSIRERLATAQNELAQQDNFTLKLVNNEVEACADELYQVICQRTGLAH